MPSRRVADWRWGFRCGGLCSSGVRWRSHRRRRRTERRPRARWRRGRSSGAMGRPGVRRRSGEAPAAAAEVAVESRWTALVAVAVSIASEALRSTCETNSKPARCRGQFLRRERRTARWKTKDPPNREERVPFVSDGRACPCGSRRRARQSPTTNAEAVQRARGNNAANSQRHRPVVRQIARYQKRWERKRVTSTAKAISRRRETNPNSRQLAVLNTPYFSTSGGPLTPQPQKHAVFLGRNRVTRSEFVRKMSRPRGARTGRWPPFQIRFVRPMRMQVEIRDFSEFANRRERIDEESDFELGARSVYVSGGWGHAGSGGARMAKQRSRRRPRKARQSWCSISGTTLAAS